MKDRPSSRIAGFYRQTVGERVTQLSDGRALSAETAAWIADGGGLAVETADRMSENVVATTGLPLAVALNFLVNQRDYVVPMAVEEPSVVAAASHAARILRAAGGVTADADAPIMTAQIQLDQVLAVETAAERLEAIRSEVLAIGDAAIPNMVARGGGCVGLECRVLDAALGMVVVEIHVDVGDAMGANLVDTVAESAAPVIAAALDGRIGLRILTNLPRKRLTRARCAIPVAALGGQLADGIARASHFAELDVGRAATHNKGIMNGIDAAAVALGQDWRAIEAGAHAFASLSGRYRPLARWQIVGSELVGTLEMPLAVGIVGGGTRTAGARAALELIAVDSARELAMVLGALGLASNFAALKALAGEGIQRGHMRLHSRRLEAPAVVGDP